MPEYMMPIHSAEARKRFAALDKFTQAYIECALWIGVTVVEGSKIYGVDLIPFDDLSEDALNDMRADCMDFQTCNAALLSIMGDDAQAGHDFWLTRNRHGAGFWDRGLGELGDKLTEAAHAYGSCDLYVGDDGMVYCDAVSHMLNAVDVLKGDGV